MSSRLLAAVLVGWVLFAPGSWMGAVLGQSTVLNVTGALTTNSAFCTIRGNGTNYREERHTLAMVSGNQYTLDLISSAPVTAGWSASLDAYMYLLAPGSNAVVAENDDVVRGGTTTSYDLRSRISYSPTVSGTYTIVVTSWAPIGSNYDGSIFNGTFPYTLTATARGLAGTITGTLTADPLNPRNTPTATFNSGRHTVSMTPGQTYTIDVNGEGGAYDYNINTYLYLLDSSGAVVAQNDGYGQGYASQIVYPVPASGGGLYTVVVTSYSPGDTFQYQLTVSTPNVVTTPTSVLPLGGIPNVRLSPQFEKAGRPLLLLG